MRTSTPDPENSFLITGIGEVLWDRFPEFKLPGGAPANMAYHAAVHGDRGVIASRIGMDDLGRDLEDYLWKKNVDTSYLQKDDHHSTGTVEVHMDSDGPHYKIQEGVAWDYLELSDNWVELAQKSDAIVFGTLAQRQHESRNTIQGFLDRAGPGCLKVLDVNLRSPFYDRSLLEQSFLRAHIVRLNRDELRTISKLFDQPQPAEWLLREFGVTYVCVTLGRDGSEIYSNSIELRQDSSPIDTSTGDVVGAGDAFTATLIHFLLRKRSLEYILKAANRYAAHVATLQGGMPEINPHSLYL